MSDSVLTVETATRERPGVGAIKPSGPQRAKFRRQIPSLVIDLFRVFDGLVVIAVGLIVNHHLLPPSQDVIAALRDRDVIFAGVVTPIFLNYCHVYTLSTILRIRAGLNAIISGLTIAATLLFSVTILSGNFTELIGEWSLTWVIVVLVGMVTGRLVVRTGLSSLVKSGVMSEVVAIVGTGERTDRLMEHISTQCRDTVEVVGVFDDRSQGRHETGSDHYPVGTLDDLLALGREGRIGKIIVALPLSAEHRLLSIFVKLKALAVDIELCPDKVGFSLLKRRSGYIGDLPLLRVAETPVSGWSYLLKSAEDMVLAGIALVVLSPLLLVTAILVKFDSPGPILFRQTRYGFNNEEFQVFKFRTMYVDKSDYSGGQQTSRGDARVTWVGRFLRRTSIDELPQLFNVLQGTMSMVGPRPHPVGMKTANRLCEEIIDTYVHRHRVKPGITGWAQVNGSRGATETAEQLERRVALDLHYVENWSLFLDLRILLMTAFKVIGDKEAF